MSIDFLVFERIEDFYATCPDVNIIFQGDMMATLLGVYIICNQRWLSFRGFELCIPRTDREFLVWRVHVGGLVGHLDIDKIIVLIKDRFYWPSLQRDPARIVS